MALLPSNRNYLAAKGNFNADSARAIANVKRAVANGTLGAQNGRAGLCLENVRNLYGIGAEYQTAIQAYDAVADKYVHTWYNPPIGVPVFWSGGSTGAGHIAVSDGQGNVYSTDFTASGYVGDGKFHLVPIASIHLHDSKLVYEGWSELLNGVRVYSL